MRRRDQPTRLCNFLVIDSVHIIPGSLDIYVNLQKGDLVLIKEVWDHKH